MKKINRRDYLISMGVGAAGAVGGGSLDIFAHGKNRLASKRQVAKALAPRWPITNTPPSPDSFVSAIIWGLAGIWYKTPIVGPPSFDVGFHSGHPQHPHRLQIRIFRNCVDVTPPDLPTTINTIKLQAVAGSTPNVFQTTESLFDRTRVDPTPDLVRDMDFRWMPDLQSFPFYPEPHAQNSYPGPRLSILNGTLYTRAKTQSTFYLVDVDQPTNCVDFGSVALYIAAAIEGTSASLQINQMSIALPKVGVEKYQIVFKNHCDTCTTPDPTSTDETKRNDFHFNRKIIILPSTRTKIGLMVKNRQPGLDPNFCYGDLEKFDDKKRRANDEAPCSAAGFGQNGG